MVVGDRGGEEGVLDVERWAELRRDHFVGGVSIKELARRHGIDRNTVRRALRSDAPPVYQRAPAVSKLDPFKDEIQRLLRSDPKLPGVARPRVTRAAWLHRIEDGRRRLSA